MKCKNCGAELSVNGYCAYCGSYFETTTKEEDCLMHKYVLKDSYNEKCHSSSGLPYFKHHYIIKCVHCGIERDILETEYERLVKIGIIVDRNKFKRFRIR